MKSRQFEILIYLLKYKKSTMRQLSNKFEVCNKTIESDIDRLSTMGIPIYCTQGVGGGVFIDEHYQFSGTFFTKEEIHHIILSLTIADSFSNIKRKESIIQKLCMLDSNLTNIIDQDLNNYLTVDLVHNSINTDTEICKLINICFNEQVLANINEWSNVACLEYVIKNDGLYLFAYCSQYMLIKVDTIQKFDVTQVEFERIFLSYIDFKNNNK